MSCLPWPVLWPVKLTLQKQVSISRQLYAIHLSMEEKKIDPNRIVLDLPLPNNGQKRNCRRQMSILSNPEHR